MISRFIGGTNLGHKTMPCSIMPPECLRQACQNLTSFLVTICPNFMVGYYGFLLKQAEDVPIILSAPGVRSYVFLSIDTMMRWKKHNSAPYLTFSYTIHKLFEFIEMIFKVCLL